MSYLSEMDKKNWWVFSAPSVVSGIVKKKLIPLKIVEIRGGDFVGTERVLWEYYVCCGNTT